MAAIARPVFLLPWHAGSAYHNAASIDQLTTQLEEVKMKKTAILVIGLLMAVGVMFAGATPSSSGNALANPDSFIPCPPHLVAPYGGSGGWSTVNVQANFAHALVTPAHIMVCQYYFGSGATFFGIEKPCPAGLRCVAERDGFRVR